MRTDSNLPDANDSLWLRLKRHFIEAFVGNLLPRQSDLGGQQVDEFHDQRRRSAYRYILLFLVVILLPVLAHNSYTQQMVPAVGTLALLAALVVNILLLNFNREAFISAPVVLLMSIIFVLLSLYYGQNYNLYLIFPLLVALPTLLRRRWAALVGVLTGLCVAPEVLTAYDSITAFSIGVSMGLTWLVSAWLVFAMTEQSRRLRGMAVTDALTGAFNRRYLELEVVKCVQSWERSQRPVSLLLLDIDHFKRINDKFGHAVGDEALKSVATLIQQRIRRVDSIYRFGGEEFVVLLSETTASKAIRVAEELCRIVEIAKVLPEGKLTISVGVSDVTQAQDAEHWFKLADAALYQAKRNGRNRVELAVTLPAPGTTVPASPKTIPDWR